jgi:hypothetical protein
MDPQPRLSGSERSQAEAEPGRMDGAETYLAIDDIGFFEVE